MSMSKLQANTGPTHFFGFFWVGLIGFSGLTQPKYNPISTDMNFLSHWVINLVCTSRTIPYEYNNKNLPFILKFASPISGTCL